MIMFMNTQNIVILLFSLLNFHLADAQSNPPIGSDVVVNLTASGSQTTTYTDGSGRVDTISNQITANLQFHISSPQQSGNFFASSSAGFTGTTALNIAATENAPGTSNTQYLSNQENYNEPDFAVEAQFFGPQFFTASGASLSGNVASLELDPPTTDTDNPEVYGFYYDGTNQTLTVWIDLPEPFDSDDDVCTIPCAAIVTGNGSSFSGVVQDASTHQPIPNAAVVIAGQSKTTDANGAFSVPYVAPGFVSVEITAPGYATYTATEPLAPFSNVQVTFQLKPATTLKSVVVPSVIGGGQAGGTVILTGPAPAGGVVVNLTPSTLWPAVLNQPGSPVPNPNVVQLLSDSVTVDPGQTTATFTIECSTVNYPVYGVVVGSYGGVSATGSVTVIAPAIGVDVGRKAADARVIAILQQFISPSDIIGTSSEILGSLNTDLKYIVYVRNQCLQGDDPPDHGLMAEQDIYLASADHYLTALEQPLVANPVGVTIYDVWKLIHSSDLVDNTCNLPPSLATILDFGWAWNGFNDGNSIRQGQSPVYPYNFN
jgi:hypothetical protein